MIAGAGASGASRGPLSPAVWPSEYSNARFFASKAGPKTRAQNSTRTLERERASSAARPVRQLCVLRDHTSIAQHAHNSTKPPRTGKPKPAQPAAQTARSATQYECPQGRGPEPEGLRRIALSELPARGAKKGPVRRARHRRRHQAALSHRCDQCRKKRVPAHRVHAARGPQEIETDKNGRRDGRRHAVGRQEVTDACFFRSALLCVLCVSSRLCATNRRDVLWEILWGTVAVPRYPATRQASWAASTASRRAGWRLERL